MFEIMLRSEAYSPLSGPTIRAALPVVAMATPAVSHSGQKSLK